MSGLTADFDDRQAALYLAQGQAALQAGDAPGASAAVDSNPAEKWAVDPVWPSAERRAAHALHAIEPPLVPPPLLLL